MSAENIQASQASKCSINGCGVSVVFDPNICSVSLFRIDGCTAVQMSKPSNMGYPIVGGNPVQDFEGHICTVERGITGVLGIGERMTLTSHSVSTGLIRKYVLDVSANEIGLIFTTVSYQAGDSSVDIDSIVENNYELCCDDDYIWSYNGGGEGPLHYYDTLQKIELNSSKKFARENMHNSLAAGIPVADIYAQHGGIAVGDASPTRREVHTPVAQTRDSAEVSIKWPGIRLDAGNSSKCWQSFVIVHKGDYFNGLRSYKKAMEYVGVVMPKSVADRSYELRWEGWGWQFEWTVDRIINKLDELQAAGVKQITIDDGWYKNAGDWDLNPEKFPNGEADMHRLVNAIHDHGMSALLWWRPCDGGRHSILYQEHPEYFIKQEDGSPVSVLSAVGNPVGDSYALCPTSQGAIESTVAFINRAMNDWHFDGFKGDYVWSLSKCYDKSHNHSYPEESTERQTDIYKAAREAMVSNDPDAFNLLCHCGAPGDFYGMQYMTQIVTADPTSLDQTRRRVKAYKALMGDRFPITTDHSAINNFITPEHTDIWYAAGIGTGAVLIEKFDFTGAEQKEYERWLRIANKEQLHKSRFIGDLYVYGYDPYESYVTEKDGVLYYAFYRDGTKFKPKGYPDIELKGLDPEKLYRIVDYINERVVATNLKGSNAVFNTRFTNYLLVKAIEIPVPDKEPINQDWGFTKVMSNDDSLSYAGNWLKGEDEWVTNTNGASVELTFAGTAVRWYGQKKIDFGKADVYLDGVAVAEVNFGLCNEENVRLFEALDIPAAIHTLRIVCKTGSIGINYIAFEEAVPEPVYEKVDALSDQIKYSGTWEIEHNEVFYAGNAKSTSEVGASVEFAFQGTAIRWYGKRSLDFGIADVYLDGELADNVYSYGEARYGQLLFERNKLPYGLHTIRIVHRLRTSDVDYFAFSAEE